MVYKQSDLTLTITSNNISMLLDNQFLNNGLAAKYSDNVINSLNYTYVRGVPQGYTTYYFTPSGRWDFSKTIPSGNVCTNFSMTLNCIDRYPIISSTYMGYSNYNGTNNYAFLFNHAGNLGYGARSPFGSDTVNLIVYVK